MALRHVVPAVVGAGWDPGIRPLFEGLFETLCPNGDTKTHDRPGVSLHHTLAARAITGVRDALCAEFRGADGVAQRYVYVELVPGAELGPAARAILSDPLFLDEETIVLPVESVAALEARRTVLDHVRSLRKRFGTTVLITSHYMEEMEELCERIAVLNHGRLVAIGTHEALKKRIGPHATLDDVFAALAGPAAAAEEEVSGYMDVRQTRRAARTHG